MFARIKNSLGLNLLLLVGVLVVGIGTLRTARQTLLLRAELRSAEERLAVMTQKQVELAGRISESDTPEAVEREAKSKLNLKNRGEEVVVVVPYQSAGDKEKQITWWQRISRFFAKNF